MQYDDSPNLLTLEGLLKSLVALKNRPIAITQAEVSEFAETFRDCRLEILRLGQVSLSNEQLHRLQQVDYRLQMIADGHAVVGSVVLEAKRCLAAFGWLPSDDT
jgi:hypothetical protein